MSLFEMLSTKKFTLSGNIDERYFQPNDDGTYKATPLFIHNVARDVMNDIKTIIVKSKDEKYTTLSDNKGQGYDQNDSWAAHEHSAEWNTKYKREIEAEAKLWKEYQKAHLDEFNQNSSTIATGDVPTTRFFSAYHPDFNGMSSAELMSMYKEAYELNKRFGEELRDTLPQRPGNLTSKEEFKDAHAKIRADIKKKVGLPEDTWVCPKIHVDERVSIIRSNSKAFKAINNADASMFEDYIGGLVTHITGSTPEAYQKEWEELYTNIEDVCDGLTRGGKGTKLNIQKNSRKNALDISIFTATTRDEDRKPVARIAKVEPTDNFYTFTLMITSGGKRPVRQISTKADLRKVLEDLIEIFEDNDMTEYIDCVENAMDIIL